VQLSCCSFGLERREEALHRRLSQTLPDRLIEQTMLWSAIELWAKGDGMKG
jgi:hypothetical protein